MKATVENLKANRDVVIQILTETFGEQNLKSKMRSLMNIVEEAEMFKTHSTINQCIEALDELSQTARRKTTLCAELIASLEEFELERNN
jgi:hypothetical protein